MGNFAISSMTSSTLILNWISREVSKKIVDKAGNTVKSAIHPDGFDLPGDVIEKIFWDHFLPEWRSSCAVLPNDLRQDICLLSTGFANAQQFGGHEYLQHGDIITTEPMSENDDGIHGRWLVREGSEFSFSLPSYSPMVSTRTHWHFEAEWSSKDPEEVYGKDHTKIFQKIMDQANWSKVDILNHIRSVDCPILGPWLKSYIDFDTVPYCSLTGLCDSIELRELTGDDVNKRELQILNFPTDEEKAQAQCPLSLERLNDTKQHDKRILEAKLEEIITNNKDMERDGYRLTDGVGTANGIIWHPGINCPGKVTFTTR